MKFQCERPNTINIAKFEDDQVWTLKTYHQPVVVAPTVVILNPFSKPHAPTDATVQPSLRQNSACATE